MAISYPYTGPRETSYLFIDAGCLRSTVRNIAERFTDDRDGLRIVHPVLGGSYNKVFYYDALRERLDGETDDAYNQRNADRIAALDKLRQLNGWHVYEGVVKRGKGEHRRSKQKKVDVMIAVDMLMHSFRRNMHRATLLASDLDFEPLLNALVQEGMTTTLWYPPDETNPDLAAAADNREELNFRSLAHALALVDGTPFWPGEPGSLPSDMTERQEITTGDTRLIVGRSATSGHVVSWHRLLADGTGTMGTWTHRNEGVMRRLLQGVHGIEMPDQDTRGPFA